MRVIYLDNNATTRVAPEVLEAMLPWLRDEYGNPSSLHVLGQRAADAVAAARSSVARLIGAGPSEIVFTSGGTEANQTALHATLARARAGQRIVTSAVEHPAVLEPLEVAEARGFTVERVAVAPSGRVDPGAVCERIDSDCALVSVMWANNETGVVNDVASIGAVCRERGVPFHVDAVQAAGKLALDLGRTPIDLCTLSAHKLHGPKGVGALYVRRGYELDAWQRGGGQENERRAGTENVPGIVGFGRAAELARAFIEGGGDAELARLRDRLEAGLLERVPDSHVNGGAEARTPNTTNLRCAGVSGEALVMLLSEQGICASTGSACSSARHAPSHVLEAMGLAPEEVSGSVRLSLSRETTEEQVERCLQIVPEVVGQLRTLAGLDR